MKYASETELPVYVHNDPCVLLKSCFVIDDTNVAERWSLGMLIFEKFFSGVENLNSRNSIESRSSSVDRFQEKLRSALRAAVYRHDCLLKSFR